MTAGTGTSLPISIGTPNRRARWLVGPPQRAGEGLSSGFSSSLLPCSSSPGSFSCPRRPRPVDAAHRRRRSGGLFACQLRDLLLRPAKHVGPRLHGLDDAGHHRPSDRRLPAACALPPLRHGSAGCRRPEHCRLPALRAGDRRLLRAHPLPGAERAPRRPSSPVPASAATSRPISPSGGRSSGSFWEGIPLTLLILLSGLGAVSTTAIEAARDVGAGRCASSSSSSSR